MRTLPLMLLLLAMACKPELKKLPLSKQFNQRKVVGQSDNERLQEASGLAVSFKNPGHFWTHNDSGGEPSLYLIDEKGRLVFTAHLEGATNYDWEDLAQSRDGSGYLYAADIGDNYAVRDSLTIYRMVEPKWDSLPQQSIPFDQMVIRYAEGPRDSETLIVNPFTQDLILLTKREDSIMVYSFSYEEGASKTIGSRGKMPLTQITAGDINERGDVLIKNYDQVFYLKNKDKTPIVELLLNGQMELIDYEVERQGEALTWSADGQSFYLLSEWNDNQPQPFYWYY